jgi:hypothetical protein
MEKEEDEERGSRRGEEFRGRRLTTTTVVLATREEGKREKEGEEDPSISSSGRIVYSREVERRLAFAGRVGCEMKKDPLSIVEDTVAPVMFRKPHKRLHVPHQAPQKPTKAGSGLISLSKRLAVKKADEISKAAWRYQTVHSRPTSTPMHRRRSLLDVS